MPIISALVHELYENERSGFILMTSLVTSQWTLFLNQKLLHHTASLLSVMFCPIHISSSVLSLLHAISSTVKWIVLIRMECKSVHVIQVLEAKIPPVPQAGWAFVQKLDPTYTFDCIQTFMKVIVLQLYQETFRIALLWYLTSCGHHLSTQLWSTQIILMVTVHLINGNFKLHTNLLGCLKKPKTLQRFRKSLCHCGNKKTKTKQNFHLNV